MSHKSTTESEDHQEKRTITPALGSAAARAGGLPEQKMAAYVSNGRNVETGKPSGEARPVAAQLPVLELGNDIQGTQGRRPGGLVRVPGTSSRNKEGVEGPSPDQQQGTADISANALPVSLQGVIQQESKHTKYWHKELLLGLFLRSDLGQEELNSLAALSSKGGHQQREDGTLSLCANNRKRKRAKDSQERPHSVFRPRTTKKQRSLTRSELSIIPFALRQLSRLDSRRGKGSPAGMKVREAWKRPGVASLTLAELESEVESRFHSSEIGREALSRHSSYHQRNNTKDQEQFLGKDAQSARSQQEETTRESTLRNPPRISEFTPLTLVYNECTLGALSKWAERGELDKEQAEEEERLRTMDSTKFHYPVPAPFFRLCSVCKEWGHYEIECKQLTKSSMVKLAKKINVQKALRGFVDTKNASVVPGLPRRPTEDQVDGEQSNAARDSGENDNESDGDDDEEYLTKSTACEFCGSGFNSENLLLCDGCDCLFHAQCLDPPLDSIPAGDWFCSKCEAYNSDVSSVVEIEGCDGFVIEQRKVSPDSDDSDCRNVRNEMGLSFSDNGWVAAVGLMRRDKLQPMLAKQSIGTSTSAKLPEVKKAPELSLGELCWMKRCNAAKGQLGRDDWWPATVVKLADRSTLKKSKGPELTPYVVKMYCVMGAGRVRASSVLPFFQHYEELGYNRIHSRQSKTGIDMSTFRKAVEEAIYEMGCKSLLHALMQARDICGASDKRSRRAGSAVAGGLEDEWNDAEETEEDGFILRARRDPSVRPSDRGTGRTPPSDMAPTPLLRGDDDAAEMAPHDSSLELSGGIEGSIVAWKSKTEALSPKEGPQSRISSATKVHYGVVIALDSSKALVRPILELEKMVMSSRTVTDTRMWRSPIRACSVAASLWLSTDVLHLVCESATPGVRSKFLKDVDCRLKEERDRVKALKLDRLNRRKVGNIGDVRLPREADNSSSRDDHAKKQPAKKSNVESTKLIAAGTGNSSSTESKNRKHGVIKNAKVAPSNPISNKATHDKDAAVTTTSTSPSEGHDDCPIQQLPRNEMLLSGEEGQLQDCANNTNTEMSNDQNPRQEDCPRLYKSHSVESKTQPGVPVPREDGRNGGKTERATTTNSGAAPATSEHSLSIASSTRNTTEKPSVHDDSRLNADDKGQNPEAAAGASNIRNFEEANATLKSLGEKSDTKETEASVGAENALLAPCEPKNSNANGTVNPHKMVSKPTQSEKLAFRSNALEGNAEHTNPENTLAPSRSADGGTVAPSKVDPETASKPQEKDRDKAETQHPSPLKIARKEVDSSGAKRDQSDLVDLEPSFVEKRLKSDTVPTASQFDTGDKATGSGNAEAKDDIGGRRDDGAKLARGSKAEGKTLLAKDEKKRNTNSQETNGVTKAAARRGSNDDSGNTPKDRQAKDERRGKQKDKKKRTRSRSRKRSGDDSKTSSTEQVEHSTESMQDAASLTNDTELTQQLFGDDVFQAEKILAERKVRSGGTSTIEYLIKWRGFSVKESTWEPERNILNRNFVRMYQTEKMEKALKGTREASQKGSTTAKMLAALLRGKELLSTGQPLTRNRLCPFCGSRSRDAGAFVTHIRVHRDETNYDAIKDAAKLAREDWFAK